MAIKIEKGIPVPPKRHRNGKYPWADMEVGDCFLIPLADSRGVSSARAVAYGRAKKDGRKYRTSQVEEGVRVWRIE